MSFVLDERATFPDESFSCRLWFDPVDRKNA